jgi:hypothetical protein
MTDTTWRVAGHVYRTHAGTQHDEYQQGDETWNVTLRLDDQVAGSPGPEINVECYPVAYLNEDNEIEDYAVEARSERCIQDASGEVNGYSEVEYDRRDVCLTSLESAMDKAGWLAREYGTHLEWDWDGSKEGLRP